MPNPIKLHIYSSKGDITKTYIFVGNVEHDIRQCLNNAANGKLSHSNERKLKSHFGAKWKALLNIKSVHGGDLADLDMDEEITLDEINAIASIKKDIELEEMQPIQQKAKSESRIKNVYIYDQELFPHDNLLELKKKISLVTKIPIYKQHIWYEYSHKRFNIMYNIYLNKKAVQISFLKTVFNDDKKKLEQIENIPIAINFYNAKKLLSVKAYDTFTILEEITSLGVSDFYLVDLDEFVDYSILKKLDSNEIEIVYYGFIILFWPMFSYSAWVDYTHNPTSFEKIYPDLALNYETNKRRFDKEKELTTEAQNLFTFKNLKKARDDIEQYIYIGITYATVQVLSMYVTNVVNIRNLFDKLVLGETIISCKCSLLHNGQKIICNKVYKNNDIINVNIPLRALVLRIKTKINILDLYIFPDGNYSIKAKWPEEELYDFDNVFDEIARQINPIIDTVNGFGNYVINSNASLERLTKKNAKFSEVYVSLIYRKDVKYQDFKALENILKEYEAGGVILLNQLSPASNTLEYYFSKGMYKFDAKRVEKHFILDNYYNFLTNAIVKSKWQQLFTFYRNTTFQYRHGDIKISIEGIKETEFAIFYMYIVNIFYKINTQYKKYASNVIHHIQQKRNIKSLKQQDPVLYDFKKLYNSPIVYSKICQKPYQPNILNEDDYAKLSDKEKKRVVKYWNFTTNTPANYFCPNTKYPYIQFTIKKHPKDYCIPCCKKKEITSDDNRIKQLIYSACITDHKYHMEKTNIIQDTRYIMNYGKFVTPGRICNLPENSIESLLYENFSESTTGIEPQCEEQNRYYIYGIEQHMKNTRFVGFVNSLLLALDISLKDLFTTISQAVRKDPSKFKILMSGEITRYFYSPKDMLETIHDAFFNSLFTKEMPINDIFIDLAYYYLNILTITFIDQSDQFENIKLLIDSKIATTSQILNPNYKTLLVVKKGKYYNPIFYLNALVFFRAKLITTKLFTHSDDVLKIIQKTVLYNETHKHSSDIRKADITLSVVHLFIDSAVNKHYTITAYFINNSNLCYVIELKRNKKPLYVPIKMSPYVISDEIDMIYECFVTTKFSTDLALLNEFIKEFNNWIAVESESKGFLLSDAQKNLPLERRVEPIYSYITVDNWLLLSNPYSKGPEKVIGFAHNNINYYHSPISKETATKLHKAPYQQLLYHPDEVNLAFCKSQKPMLDNRIKNITRNIYDYHLYELLLLEFTEIFNKEKNVQLRHKIKKQILGTIDASSIDTINKIAEYVDEYFAQYPNEPENSKDEDNTRIIEQINLYIVKHHDKNILLNQIDMSFYNFDKVQINFLKTLSREKIVSELRKVAKRVVDIVSDNNINTLLSYEDEFPNMLVSCQDKKSKGNIYCKQKKLIITQKKLDELLQIMSDDILNPFKQKWIFNVIFTDQIIGYFKFQRHPHEIITIEVQ